MADYLNITRGEIKSRTTSKSFSRGNAYYLDGSISQTIKRGDVIEARCRGSYAVPYHVRATLSETGVASASCNCEYDWGGDCKHIVALLLTYLNDPQLFDEYPSLHKSLIKRNKDDLIELIKLMVTRYPDLQSYVDQPTAKDIADGEVTIDVMKIKRSLRTSFYSYSYHYDYYDQQPVFEYSIGKVTTLATRFSQQGYWHHATLLYRTILETFAELSDGEYYDEDGILATEINDTVTALDECLHQESVSNDNNERVAILKALLGIYIWDIDFGGIDLGHEAPEVILSHIQRQDIPQIRQLIEKERDKADSTDSYRGWSRKAYETLLIELDTLDDVDPDIVLQRLKSQGLYFLLLKKLIELNQLDDAVDVIQEHFSGEYNSIKAFRLLVTYGHDARALQIAEARMANAFNVTTVTWLIDMYAESKKHKKLLYWQQIMMDHQPLFVNYLNLKNTASLLHQWEQLYPKVLHDLKQKRVFDVLTKVYLEEQEWNQAWQTLSNVKDINGFRYGKPLDLEVAEATQHATPERAIPIFIKYARMYIDARGRDNYASAASLLVMAQRAYDDVGNFEVWEDLIVDIRLEFKRLPALQDELNKAGL